MKNIILLLFVPLLFACQKEHVLEAQLGIVVDNTMRILHDENEDITDVESIRRFINTVYHCVNESDDSIFIPIGIPYSTSHLVANIESRSSLKTSVVSGFCERKNRYLHEAHSFAPGDTIYIRYKIHIDSDNDEDDEWLKNISTKELLMKIRINADSLYAMKSHLPIPRIIFNNDTSDVNINPVPIVKNRNTSK